MDDTMRKPVVACLRAAFSLIATRGYSTDPLEQQRNRRLDVRRAIGLCAENYDVHVAALHEVSIKLPGRAHHAGITDWETYKRRTGAEVQAMLTGVINRLENDEDPSRKKGFGLRAGNPVPVKPGDIANS